MKSNSFILAALAAFFLAAGSLHADVPLGPGDTVLFYGNSMVERLLEHGETEAIVQLSQPEKQLHFRSLAWTGDEVANRWRAEGYADHMKSLLAEWPAKVLVIGYGMNESFAGAAGLADFRTQLDGDLDQLARLHPGAKLVVLSPIAVEKGSDARNADVEAYAKALEAAAKARAAVYVDLFSASRAAYATSKVPLTTNGIHLNAAGNHTMAPIIAAAFIGENAVAKVSARRVAEVAPATAQKSHFVAEVVRPKNGVLYYGVRKRADERATEIPLYLQRIEKADALIHELAASPDSKFANYSPITLPPLPKATKTGSNGDLGVVRPAAEAQSEFKVADGFAVNLFASDEQFPELRAPVQIAFDARGRLWIVTMPSFPHTVPGQPREDKIIVLEDTDRDGKADKCTTFADGLDALDGVAFSEQGVIVSEQPRHWVMQDTDGDGHADTKRELLRGVDVTDSHHGGMIATDPVGAVWFCDGVFHRSQFETPFGVHRSFDSTTLRHNLRTGRVETEWQSITPNPWKITFDRTGNAFQMYGDGLVLDGLALTATPLGVYHPFNHGGIIGYGKGSAAASISSPNFPDDYQQGMASAALLGNHAVSITKLDFSGGKAKGSGRIDIVSSPNAAFRPADVAFGFDGALYVSDFSSTIIGHAQNPMRDPRWNHVKGRIWRVVYTGKPVAKDWPRIEGASATELCTLLTHSQDIVRQHVRIELWKLGKPALAGVDKWVANTNDDQALLEALFVAEGFGETRPALLDKLLKSQSAMHRAAAVHLVRLQADRLDAATLLHEMAADPHPRVRMEVVDAVAHLRSAFPHVEHALHALTSAEPAVKQMVADLSYGTTPRIGRSVPVLELAPETRVSQWVNVGDGLYRTFIRTDAALPATLAVRYSFLDIAVNGIQVLSQDNQWSSAQQAQFTLHPGLNVIEITFRNLKGNPPAVHVFSPLGQKLAGAGIPSDAAQLAAISAEWDKSNAELGHPLRIQAVPNAMQFAPRELRAKAGGKVRIIFTNPDLMLHNLVLIAPGAEEEVGALADKLAAQPDGQAKGYIPASPKVLQATALVAPNTKAELSFTAPNVPGEYPFLCTFPGHWRTMKGMLIVESTPFAALARSNAESQDAYESNIPKDRLIPARIEDHASNPGGGNDASALFNGTTRNGSGTASTSDDGKTFRGYGKGDTLTVHLDKTKVPHGYDLTAIRTMSGHGDARAGQHYTVSVALAHAPSKFVSLAKADAPCNGGSSEILIANDNGKVLPGGNGVIAVRFEFADGALGYGLYREICITGTPAEK